MQNNLDAEQIVRRTPNWKTKETRVIQSKENFVDVVEAKYPLGVLPTNLVSKNEIELILKTLPLIEGKKYDNTENVRVWGNPFVDSKTITEYLTAPRNPFFETIVNPIFEKLCQFIKGFGIQPEPLIDSYTGLPYHSKVIRKISVPKGCIKSNGNICTVAHFDDIVRDSMQKPDFRLPKCIKPNNFSQFSVCIPLDNGFYAPDYLEVYNYRYFPSNSEELNDWRVGSKSLKGVLKHQHKPKVGEVYMFNTQNVHDVLGGDSRSNRINFSIFFLYVPELNKVFYYN